MRTTYSDKIEDKIKQIHSHSDSPEHKRKKTMSRAILFADIIVIVGMLIFFTNRFHEKEFESSSIISENIEYIVSISPQSEYINFLVSMKNKDKNAVNLGFAQQNAGEIQIRDKFERHITTLKFAKNIKDISLAAGESRSYIVNLDKKTIYDYAKENTDTMTQSQSKIFSFGKSDIELNILLQINTEPSVSANIKYAIEVK